MKMSLVVEGRDEPDVLTEQHSVAEDVPTMSPTPTP